MSVYRSPFTSPFLSLYLYSTLPILFYVCPNFTIIQYFIINSMSYQRVNRFNVFVSLTSCSSTFILETLLATCLSSFHISFTKLFGNTAFLDFLFKHIHFEFFFNMIIINLFYFLCGLLNNIVY